MLGKRISSGICSKIFELGFVKEVVGISVGLWEKSRSQKCRRIGHCR
jgi:hypothetical protein